MLVSFELDPLVKHWSFPRKACPELAEGRESSFAGLTWTRALRQAQGKLAQG
jgi:hypothetical protein